MSSGHIEAWVGFAGGSGWEADNRLINDGAWHHIAVTYVSSSLIIYIDNVPSTPSTRAADSGSTSGVNSLIGKREDDTNCFNGSMDELRIYNRALSATEVTSLYNASKKIIKVNAPQNTKLTDGLVGMWTFNGQDMINGTTAHDVTGNGLEAYFLNGPKLTSGRIGQGVALDADNDVIIASTTSIGEGSALTVSAWVRFNNPTNNVTKEIVNKYRSGAGMQQWLFIKDRNNATGQLRFAVWNSSDVEAYATSDSAWPTDTSWHHVAGVYDGANVYVYGDGTTLDSSPNAQTGAIKSYSNYVCFGGEWTGATCSDAGNELDGDLDEVRIYNRALTAAEIKRLYEMGK
jgi:hypothetical protein